MFLKLFSNYDSHRKININIFAASYSLGGKSPVELTDIPGHERLRLTHFNSLKDSLRGVIYVIDASTLQKQLRDATEFLFKILSDPKVVANRVPVIIACHKQVGEVTFKI